MSRRREDEKGGKMNKNENRSCNFLTFFNFYLQTNHNYSNKTMVARS